MSYHSLYGDWFIGYRFGAPLRYGSGHEIVTNSTLWIQDGFLCIGQSADRLIPLEWIQEIRRATDTERAGYTG